MNRGLRLLLNVEAAWPNRAYCPDTSHLAQTKKPFCPLLLQPILPSPETHKAADMVQTPDTCSSCELEKGSFSRSQQLSS